MVRESYKHLYESREAYKNLYETARKFLIKDNKKIDELTKDAIQKNYEIVLMAKKIYTRDETIEKYEKALKEIKCLLKDSMNTKSNAYKHFDNVEKAIDKIKEVIDE